MLLDPLRSYLEMPLDCQSVLLCSFVILSAAKNVVEINDEYQNN